MRVSKQDAGLCVVIPTRFSIYGIAAGTAMGAFSLVYFAIALAGTIFGLREASFSSAALSGVLALFGFLGLINSLSVLLASTGRIREMVFLRDEKLVVQLQFLRLCLERSVPIRDIRKIGHRLTGPRTVPGRSDAVVPPERMTVREEKESMRPKFLEVDVRSWPLRGLEYAVCVELANGREFFLAPGLDKFQLFQLIGVLRDNFGLPRNG